MASNFLRFVQAFDEAQQGERTEKELLWHELPATLAILDSGSSDDEAEQHALDDLEKLADAGHCMLSPCCGSLVGLCARSLGRIDYEPAILVVLADGLGLLGTLLGREDRVSKVDAALLIDLVLLVFTTSAHILVFKPTVRLMHTLVSLVPSAAALFGKVVTEASMVKQVSLEEDLLVAKQAFRVLSSVYLAKDEPGKAKMSTAPSVFCEWIGSLIKHELDDRELLAQIQKLSEDMHFLKELVCKSQLIGQLCARLLGLLSTDEIPMAHGHVRLLTILVIRAEEAGLLAQLEDEICGLLGYSVQIYSMLEEFSRGTACRYDKLEVVCLFLQILTKSRVLADVFLCELLAHRGHSKDHRTDLVGVLTELLRDQSDANTAVRYHALQVLKGLAFKGSPISVSLFLVRDRLRVMIGCTESLVTRLVTFDLLENVIKYGGTEAAIAVVSMYTMEAILQLPGSLDGDRLPIDLNYPGCNFVEIAGKLYFEECDHGEGMA